MSVNEIWDGIIMKTRRNFLKLAALMPLTAGFPLTASSTTPFSGKFIVTVQARGAWDVTCFCDPKTNQTGEPAITNWSNSGEVEEIGNIRFAPFAKNQEFFQKHAKKMLVINGVDSQTNSHSIGETVNWSGRTATGFPTLTAMYSAEMAPSLPLSYMSFGSFSPTEKLIRATQLGDLGQIGELLKPNVGFDRPVVDEELWSLIRTFHANDSRAALSSPTLLAGNRSAHEAYLSSLQAMESLVEFGAKLPSYNELAPRGEYGALKMQAQFAVLGFKYGVSASADLSLGGFDTHVDNDSLQTSRLAELTDGIDYLWDAAEEAGIADRLLVIVGSDFSRTPYYNSGAGKDHWPVGSYIIMEKGVGYTNKVVAGTDELQNPRAVDPATLEPSNFGTKILASHVHDSLRDYIGLSSSILTGGFPLNSAEKFNFFE